jgi:hypothetical protein
MKFLSFALVIALSTSAFALPPKSPPWAADAKPKLRDLYVGCFLFLKSDSLTAERTSGVTKSHSATACVDEIALTIAMFRDKPDGFCPSGAVDFDSDPIRSMASAFLGFYEGLEPGASGIDGQGGFLAAAKRKWPCR